jgi:hypothetical protein
MRISVRFHEGVIVIRGEALCSNPDIGDFWQLTHWHDKGSGEHPAPSNNSFAA